MVLELAVAQPARWRAQRLDLRVALNVSVGRLLEDGVVEITESVFRDDPDRAFIGGILASSADEAIAESTLVLARSLRRRATPSAAPREPTR